MRQRCGNPRTPNFHLYGGRGIKVCDRWANFANFLADMGERPAGTSIDRIDNDGNYGPENCRWATPREQGRNRRTSRMLTIGDETLTVREWSRRSGISNTTIHGRLSAGMAPREAVFSPPLDDTRLLTFKGRTQTMCQWADELGLQRPTVCGRLKKGWSVERALGPLERQKTA